MSSSRAAVALCVGGEVPEKPLACISDVCVGGSQWKGSMQLSLEHMDYMASAKKNEW